MEQIIIELLTIQNQYRIFHWQTPSYSGHKAFGKAYDNFATMSSGSGFAKLTI